MDMIVKNIWAEALESGDYKQTSGKLFGDYHFDEGLPVREDRYCCLGVLCNLYLKHKVELGEQHYDDYSNTKNAMIEDEFLPSEVANWAGIPDHFENIFHTDVQSQLAEKNDSGEDFKSIAAWIRENL